MDKGGHESHVQPPPPVTGFPVSLVLDLATTKTIMVVLVLGSFWSFCLFCVILRIFVVVCWFLRTFCANLRSFLSVALICGRLRGKPVNNQNYKTTIFLSLEDPGSLFV